MADPKSPFDTGPILFDYRTYRLDPKSSNFAFLAGKYAALNQQALITDPLSFGVAYSSEGALSPSDYLTRLSRPHANVFICVAHPKNLPEKDQDLEHGIWVGMVSQIGPTTKETFWLRNSGAEEPLEDGLETKWHQTGTWIDPAHRGKGLAKKVVECAVSYAVATIAGDVQQVRVRAFASPTNDASKALYNRLGFEEVGLITIPEAMVGNGNEIYPFHGKEWRKSGGSGLEMFPEEILQNRAGLYLERVIKKEIV